MTTLQQKAGVTLSTNEEAQAKYPKGTKEYVLGLKRFQYLEKLDLLNDKWIETDEVLDIIQRVRSGRTKGLSTLSTDCIKGLITGINGESNLEAITLLINIIVRGWVDDADADLLTSIKGVALPKGDNDWRPIGIQESLMYLTETLIRKKTRKKLIKIAGSFQCGLKQYGLEILGTELQLQFDKALDDKIIFIIIHLDVKNAFNELCRKHLLIFIKEHFPQWYNYFRLSYAREFKVWFSEVAEVLSAYGVTQGSCTSSLLFDAVLGQALINEGIDINFINLIHDDVYIKGLLTEVEILIIQLEKVTKVFKCLHLEISKNKNAVLSTDELPEDIKSRIANAYGNEKITFKTDGLVIGGIPIGTDAFANSICVQRSKEIVEEAWDLTRMIGPKHPGKVIKLLTACICPRIGYLIRNIPFKNWTTQEGLVLTNHSLHTGSSTMAISFNALEFINLEIDLMVLHVCEFKVLNRDNLDSFEIESMKLRTHIKIRNGGLGLGNPYQYADAAFISRWTAVCKQIRVPFPNLEFEGRHRRVEDGASKIRQLWNEFGADIPTLGKFGEGPAAGNGETMVIRDLAEGRLRSEGWDGKGLQGVLTTIVDDLNIAKYTKTCFGSAKVVMKKKHSTIQGGSNLQRQRLQQWIACQHQGSGQWITIIHLKSARLTALEIQCMVMSRLNIEFGRLDRNCPVCDAGIFSHNAHSETCVLKGGNPKKDLHDEICDALARRPYGILTKIPTAKVTLEPCINYHFRVAMDKITGKTPVDFEENVLTAKRERADISIRFGKTPLTLIDLCVACVHTKSSEVNNGTPGGVADHYERTVKDPKHARFEADPKYLRGMGFDSVGGFSVQTSQIIKSIFRKDSGVPWKSDQMRIFLKQRTIATITKIICKAGAYKRFLLHQIRDTV